MGRDFDRRENVKGVLVEQVSAEEAVIVGAHLWCNWLRGHMRE